MKCFFRVSYVPFQAGKKMRRSSGCDIFVTRTRCELPYIPVVAHGYLKWKTFSAVREVQKLKKKKERINKGYKPPPQSGHHYSHTSLCGVALDPRGDGRRPHLVAAGHADVVPRHSLQPGDFALERRRCDVDHPSHRHLSFPPADLFDLAFIGQLVITSLPSSSCGVRRYEPHPDVTFPYWRETVVSGAPAQLQLTGLSLCDLNTRDWTGRYCKTP